VARATTTSSRGLPTSSAATPRRRPPTRRRRWAPPTPPTVPPTPRPGGVVSIRAATSRSNFGNRPGSDSSSVSRNVAIHEQWFGWANLPRRGAAPQRLEGRRPAELGGCEARLIHQCSHRGHRRWINVGLEIQVVDGARSRDAQPPPGSWSSTVNLSVPHAPNARSGSLGHKSA
jgi:hypothetical protein